MSLDGEVFLVITSGPVDSWLRKTRAGGPVVGFWLCGHDLGLDDPWL
jgi:hypothetical protein